MMICTRRKFLSRLGTGIAAFALSTKLCAEPYQNDLPNILWITSEDNSPFLGCYGDSLAVTPNMDQMAAEGFLYTHAYANAPVCAPARNTIITGVYACSNGHQHMRSKYARSETVKMFPEYLRDLGYFCTNNSKQDYNTNAPKRLWHESSKKAHYSHRKPSQPFFHIKNLGVSHESSIHKSIPASQLKHDPNKMKLPPYHPDTKDIRHDWAQYYDKVTQLDQQVGKLLRQLEKDGLADNTIVFYYGDHGGVLPRSKRFIYESGTRVPFLVRIPKKYKHLFPADKPGTKIDRLISFVDLAPTILSIAGIPIPAYMQGNAFLGRQKTQDPKYAYMFRGRMDERYDMSRSVRDKNYRYIRNYMPFRIYGQHIEYLWRAPATRSWEQMYLKGKCNAAQSVFWNTKPIEELYHTKTDPWETKNLAENPKYAHILKQMRQANRKWIISIYDAGFIPEADLCLRAGNMPIYDYMRSDKVDLPNIINAAETATQGNPENLERLKSYLKNKDSAVRYWGAVGLLILKQRAVPAADQLTETLNDKYPNVVTVAAETLYRLGRKKVAIQAFIKIINHPNEMARCHVLNAVDAVNCNNQQIKKAVADLLNRGEPGSRKYDMRAANGLLKKWNR